MTNQAAQTMPELPEPLISGGNDKSRPDLGRGCTGYTAAQMQQYAIDYAATLALSRGVPEGWMRDVADAAAALDKRGDRQMAARLMHLHKDMLAAAPAAAGAQGEDECSNCNGRGEVGGPVGQTAETFDYVTEPCPECTPQPAAADGGVRERARELLASECPECGGSNGYMVPAGEYAGAWQKCGTCQDGERLQSVNRSQAMRAVATALSSHRQAGDGQDG
jgi:hypothetical protein